jgi:uncharacterized protein (TIGR03437 family)
MEGHPVFAVRVATAVLLLGSSLFGQAVYVPNYTTSNVSGYLMDPSTGALAAVPGLPVKTGTSPVQALIHPSGKFLYVLDSGAGDISLYSISSPTGALSVIGCPQCDALSPSGMAIDPAGQLLFVTNLDPGTVTPYTINPSTGALTKGAAAGTGSDSRPVQPVVDPTGRYLYVADSNTGQVSGFLIDGGALTSMPGSPFQAGSGPSSVAASRTAVFVANQNSGDISVYQVGPEGSLAPAGLTVPTGGIPTSIAVDPTGNYIYVTNQMQVVVFNRTPNGAYPLTFVRAYSAGITPSFVAVAPDGNFVYVVNSTSNEVSGFAISAGGTLIPIGTASTYGVSGPRLLTVGHIGDTTAISLAAGYPTPASAPYGTPVTIKGAIRDTLKAGTIPRGSVTITVNGSAVGNGAVALDATAGFNLVFDASTQYLPVGSNVIQITYNPGPGFEAATPMRISITVTKAPTSLTIVPPANPIAAQPIAISVSVPQTGGRYPAGSVRFSVDGVFAGLAASLTNGTASISYTAAAGDHAITVDYGGDSYFAATSAGPVAFHAKYTTSTTVTSSSSSLVCGQTPVFTATVGAGGGAIGGTVDFFDGGTRINAAPVPVSAGQAQFGSYAIGSGNHAITAQYSGDANNLASSNSAAPLLLTVNRASVQVSTPQLSGNAVYGPLTFSVAVAVVAPGSGVPNGTITLNDGGATIATATLANGAAIFSVASLGAGSHLLTAIYTGGSNYGPATSAALPLTVAKATPELTLSSTPASELVSGQTAILTVVLGGVAPATGTVGFYDSGASITSSPIRVVGGQAQFAYMVNGAGPHRFSALYSGDANCNGVDSGGTPFVLTVRQASSAIGVLISSGSNTFGQPLTFTAKVSALAPGSGTPSGSVSFKDGPTVLGTATLVAGSASLTTSTLAAGSHSISAVYGGGVDFAGSTSAPLALVEEKAPTNTILTVSQSAATTVLTALVTGSGTSIPGGSVQFSSGANLLGTAGLFTSGPWASATLSLGAMAGTVTAAYSGSGNFYASTSQAVNILSIPKVVTNLAMKVSPSPAIIGQPVTCTLNLSWSGGAPPDGTIQLYDGGSLIGSASVAAQVVFTAIFGAGTHNLIASYAGNVAYLSSSASYALIVNRNGSSVVLTTGAAVAVFGQSVALTAKVLRPATSTAALPTGKVDFLEGSTARGSAPLVNGVATAVLPVLEPGTHQITAVYSGDAYWDSIGSNTVSVTVAKAATAVEISAASGSAGHGEMPLTANLVVKQPGAGVPTGTVLFVEAVTNQVLATAPLAGGIATATVPADIGSTTVIAVYGGDAGFLGSSSAPATQFSILNAASYGDTELAPDEMVTVFSPDLTSETLTAGVLPLPAALGGVSVILTDSAASIHHALLLSVSPAQVTFLVPPDAALGPATLRVETPGGAAVSAAIRIGPISPGVFTANAKGQGVASAQIIRVHSDGSQGPPENTAIYDSTNQIWAAVPIDRSSPGDELYLVLYATGIRNHSMPVMVAVNGQLLASLYAGMQPAYPGLDQVNVLLPASVQEVGTAKIELTTDGIVSNTVTLVFQ